MTRYIIDSSAWMEYLGGTPRGNNIKQIIEGESVACSIIAIAELADRFDRSSILFDDHFQFIKSRAVILPITVHIALLAGKLKNAHRKKHPKFGLADAIHLATAKEEHALIVTADTDFSGAENILLI